MSDDLRSPTGKPTDDERETGEVTEKDDQEAEEIDEQISDDPVVEENGATYDPATQAPPEAER